MKVLTLVPHQLGHAPGQRGSIELWEKVLGPAGIELDFVPFETEKLRSILYSPGGQAGKTAEMVQAYFGRIRLLSRLDYYDAVFVYREAALIGPAILERMIAREKPIIYQLDDPLFVPYKSPSNGLLSYLKFFGKVKEIIRMSKVVMVNSTPIKQYAAQFNKNVWQVPSVVDTEKFTYDERDQDSQPVCVGWSGSPTTIRNLKMIERPMQRLAENGSVKFKFIGSADFGLKGIRHEAKSWSADTEVDDLRAIQIGLVPLPDDNPWNPYKFIMKTAQYMALGIVPVGTPSASNPEVIRHGENGFLAATDDEWVKYIEVLTADQDLRMRMSRSAVADARAHYSLAANAERIVAAFESAV
jgi:glycosyltransferase involved in cell wall biosynthesis